MSGKAEFHRGDNVWVIYTKYRKWYVHDSQHEISEHKGKIYWWLTRSGMEGAAERNAFSTLREAEEECTKRNKENNQ